MRHMSAFWGNIAEDASKMQTDADVLEAAHHLVDIHLIFLREHEIGNSILDSNELPVGKDAFVNAFRVVIATENRPNIRSLLVKAGITLAHFQDNIGDPIILRPAPDSEHSAFRGRVDIARIRTVDRAILNLGEERLRLAQIFQKASRLAEGKKFYHA
ncbi:hypothetical protein EPK99_15480 [Neorhizobium lilium]|uniref:Uncharacterized protein n=1 Tax=Neorhizobium lilium TaxID=2503024 RepID=A0A444LFV2_9HYPH|nr:hypothetical protein [Neorhizobium lilium]RWX77059.1 hypothetical protein EPK99_15480 [Neorhizobium lilium]